MATTAATAAAATTAIAATAAAATATTSQRSTFRRLGDRIIQIVNPGVRQPLERREYSRAEVRTFQAQLAAAGVDLGDDRYPSARSVAFRGPEDSIADRPWRNGVFLDLPSTPITWEERVQHQHQQYLQQRQRQRLQQQQQRAAAAANQSLHERRQHAYERRLRLPPVLHATPPQPLSQLQRLYQLQRFQQQQQRQRQMQQQTLQRQLQQKQRLMVQQEWEDDDEARAMALVIANVDWDDDRLFARTLSLTATNSDDGASLRIGPAPGTADWDNDPSYQPVRHTASSMAESDGQRQQQQHLGRGPSNPATPPNLCYLSTPVDDSDSDSDDSDIEYVNSQGVPFPKTDKNGLSPEDAEYANSAPRPFPKVPMRQLSNGSKHLV